MDTEKQDVYTVSVRATASMNRRNPVLKWKYDGIGQAASQAQKPSGS